MLLRLTEVTTCNNLVLLKVSRGHQPAAERLHDSRYSTVTTRRDKSSPALGRADDGHRVGLLVIHHDDVVLKPKDEQRGDNETGRLSNDRVQTGCSSCGAEVLL